MSGIPKPAVTALYTIGHSTRTLDELISALKAHGVSAKTEDGMDEYLSFLAVRLDELRAATISPC